MCLLRSYYPDFVSETLVVRAPSFLQTVWSVVSRLTPSWWGLQLLDAGALAELERREGVRLCA